MKKFLFYSVTLFLLLHATIANAQVPKSKWINVIAGINSPLMICQNAYGNPEFEYFPTLGLTGGAGMSYFINTEWGVNGSLLATKMGQNYKGVQSGGDAERKVKLFYLEVPLSVMKKVLIINKPVWLSWGPDFFFLLNAKQEYQRTGGNPLPNEEGMAEDEVNERYKPLDVSLNLAVSQFYKLNEAGTNMLLISFNTSFGLTDINSSEYKTPQPDGTYSGSHNYYMGIKVGLMLNTSRKDKWDSSF